MKSACYTLLTLATILSQYFFIRIYQRQDGDSWFWYFVVGLFGIFTHYFFFFILLVQAVFFFAYRPLFPKGSLKKFILIAVVYTAVFSPWAWYVLHLGTISNETPELQVPNSVNVFNAFSQFIFGFQNDHLNTILVSLWPITVLLGFMSLRKSVKIRPEVAYMVLSIFIPIVLAFVVSVALIPLFVSRYLILTVPSLFLFISWIFSTYSAVLRRIMKGALIAIMIIGLAVEAVSPSTPVKENYEQAAAYLKTHAAAEDAIAVSAPFTIYPVEYYYNGPAQISTIPLWNQYVTGPIPAFSQATLPQQVQQIAANHQNLWLLLSYDQGYQKNIQTYMDTHYQRLSHIALSPGMDLYEYKLRYDPLIFGKK